MTRGLRVGLVADYLEEGWPSMDLVAEMLARYVPETDPAIAIDTLRPPFRRRLGRIVRPAGSEWTRDRVINRFWDYPRWLRARARAFDVMHVVDHSYAHLVHAAGGVPCLVTLHDLDAFGTLIGRSGKGLPAALVRRQVSGLRHAGGVACVSRAVKRELDVTGLLPGQQAEVITNGVHPSCVPEPEAAADARVALRLGPMASRLELLHVGSVIPRKRIDVLVQLLARLATRHPSVVLVRVGGDLTAAQRAQARALGVADRVVELPRLSRADLAAVYRRAALVLLPSEREGFGLPVVEALACGTPVLLSDVPVLREVAGDAAAWAPVGDVDAWTDGVERLLAERRDPQAWQARRERGLRVAAAYSWRNAAARYAAAYRHLSGAAAPEGAVA